jgi:hypothetical protein
MMLIQQVIGKSVNVEMLRGHFDCLHMILVKSQSMNK